MKNRVAGVCPIETQLEACWSGLRILQLCSLALLFLFAYRSVLGSLVQDWWTNQAHSHGFLVVPIGLFIVWTKRNQLRRLPVKPTIWLGIFFMGAAGILLILSEIGGVLILGELSLILMLAGIILELLGISFFKNLWVPLAYLFFMLPILEGIILTWNWQFQLLTARMGVFILRVLGIPVQLEQNRIVLPDIILRVADSCSGARYLISVLALAIPLAYVLLKRMRNRITLVVLSVVIGVVANWIRVVCIGLWAYYGGAVVHGPFHVFQAVSVAWVAFAGLFCCAWGLSSAERKVVDVKGTDGLLPTAENAHSVSTLWHHSWVNVVLILVLVIAYLLVYYRGPVPLKQNFATFPSVIGQWVELRQNSGSPLLQAEGADDELLKTYSDGEGHIVHLYIAYFHYQRQAKEAMSYLMAPFHHNAQMLPMPSAQPAVVVNWKHVTTESQDYEVLFWYDFNGRIVANKIAAKGSTIWDALTRGRTNGALVMVYNEVGQNRVLEYHAGGAEKFALELLPILREFLP